MKALILSAGQGSRLLPLTKDRPKCLLQLGSRRVIEWQVHELSRCGVDDIVVVVGFGDKLVEAVLAKLRRPGLSIRTVFNPFFRVADNLCSCWMARGEMDRDFILVNGDTLFEARVALRLLGARDAPVTVAVDQKSAYDADDMKVCRDGTRLLQIGKELPQDTVDGESVGVLRFQGEGPAMFAEALERLVRKPEALGWWYLKAIGNLATQFPVETVSVEGLEWHEIDCPPDLAPARRMVEGWDRRSAKSPGSSAAA